MWRVSRAHDSADSAGMYNYAGTAGVRDYVSSPYGASHIRPGPTVLQMMSSSSRNRAALPFAPTICLTCSPSANSSIVGREITW